MRVGPTSLQDCSGMIGFCARSCNSIQTFTDVVIKHMWIYVDHNKNCERMFKCLVLNFFTLNEPLQ